MERRTEPRVRVALRVQVCGNDAQQEAFSETVLAINLSRNGSLLWGVQAELRSGGLVTIRYANRAALMRVVWVFDEDDVQGSQVALRLIKDQDCPWEEALPTPQAAEQLC
jgi:hypothetical protein